MRYKLKLRINGILLLQILLAWCSVYFILKTNTYPETSRLAIISVVLWGMSICLIKNNLIHCTLLNSFSVAFVLFAIYILCFTFLKYGILTACNAVLSQFTYFSGIFIFVAYLGHLNPKSYTYILGGILVIWGVVDLQLLMLCKMIPNIGRLIVSHNADAAISMSVGSPYALAESSCFIVIAIVRLTTSLKYKIKPTIKMGLFLIAILKALTVYETQSTITTLIMILGVIGAIFLNMIEGKRGNTPRKRLVMQGSIICFIILFLVSKEIIGSALISHFSSGDSVFAIRMYQVGQALAYNQLSSDFSERIALMLTSFRTFLEHPLVGNMYIGGAIAGGHCGLFDALSNYGLMGGAPYFAIFFTYFKFLKKKLYNYDFLLWFPLLIMSLLNPIVLYQTYFSVLFVVPSLYYLFGRNDVSRKDSKKYLPKRC